MATQASPTKPSPTTNTKASRLPAPTLFVGPPSRNASNLSLSRTSTNTTAATAPNQRAPLKREHALLSRPPNPETGLPDPKALDAAGRNQQDIREEAKGRQTGGAAGGGIKKLGDKQVEGQWREMQNALAEVELTAQSSTQVFGESHAAALNELKKAQVELARAWGRGNDSNDTASAKDNAGPELNIKRFGGADEIASDRANRTRSGTADTASSALSGESIGSTKSGRSPLEDETAQDIRLASERRAVNEAYFKKVDKGVKDVVAKLEVVAEAMKGVEGESRSLWSQSTRSSDESQVERSEPTTAIG